MQANQFPTDSWADGPVSMKKASFVLAMLSTFRKLSFRSLCLLPLVFILSLEMSAAQAGLPRSAVSIPMISGRDLGAAIQDMHSCIVSGSPVVMPAVTLHFDVNPSAVSAFNEQSQALKILPSDSEVWLHIVVDSSSSDAETEQRVIDRVNSFLSSAPFASPLVRGVIIEPTAKQKISDLSRFALLRLAVSAKSTNSALRLAFTFQPGFIGQNVDIVKRLATYSDLLGVTDSPEWHAEAKWIADNALNKPLILKLADRRSPQDSYLSGIIGASGSSVEMLWSIPPEAKAATQLCETRSFMTRSIPPGLLHLESVALPFSIQENGITSEDARWFGNGLTSDLAVLAPRHGLAGTSHIVKILSSSKTQYKLQCFDPVTGSQVTESDPIYNAMGWTAACVSSGDYTLIEFHKMSDSGSTVFSKVEVKSGVDLSVEEIIARWQQYREAQKQRLDNYQATSFMNLHFESTSVTQAFDISMKLRQFFDRNEKMDLDQTELYVNGVRFNNKHGFPLPQLEPEKVLIQPMELTINERYNYKLLGTEQIDGAFCYVVSVEPRAQDDSLYSGKIWIDSMSFREVRQSLSQRSNRSSIVVNVETQNFALIKDDNDDFFNLLSSISSQQTLNAAGRDFQLQRTLNFSEYSINTSHFKDDLTAALDSNDPMYRDTDQGLRQLQKRGGERVLVETSDKRIVSLVSGAFYQGTYSFPIPIAGLSLADFDFRHTGAQLSVFFAGPVLVTNLSKQYTPKLRLAADLALNALPGEYRIYQGYVEDTKAAIWSWEQTLGGRATWQANTHLSLTGYNYLAYDVYLPTSDTSTSYLAPRNGVAFLPGVQVRMTEKGYIFTADGTRGQRISWKQFGDASMKPIESGYTLYDADLNKDYFIRKFTKGGWDFSYYGGDQLDRFSRYFPSFFSNPRIHGIPGGTDSFDAIAQGNVHYGFNVMDLMKIEGLYSYARARNLDESSHFRKFDGVETNFNTAGPKETLLQGTISYALDGNLARYNSRWGVMVMIFKPFK
jgi:hypothetical protein